MIEIPKNVEDWTRGKIVDLVDEGYDENDILEFKLQINVESDRLAKTVCAFANTKGGTIIFGINNDREQPLHTNDRLAGLQDSDQLKRQIIDKLKQIQPNIPIDKIVFKKSNIRLPNKNVIVVLKILPSNLSPHQYNNIFFKRLSDGNEPMSVEEIKQKIISARRNERLLVLLSWEGGSIRDALEAMKKSLHDKDISSVFQIASITKYDSFSYFLYNQSHYYDIAVQNSIYDIVDIIQRFSELMSKIYDIAKRDEKNGKTKLFEQVNVKTADEFIIKTALEKIDSGLEALKTIEKHTGIQMISSTELLAKIAEARKHSD